MANNTEDEVDKLFLLVRENMEAFDSKQLITLDAFIDLGYRPTNRYLLIMADDILENEEPAVEEVEEEESILPEALQDTQEEDDDYFMIIEMQDEKTKTSAKFSFFYHPGKGMGTTINHPFEWFSSRLQA